MNRRANFLAALILAVIAIPAAAQVSPRATPTPTVSEPMIISRADDFPADRDGIIGAEPETENESLEDIRRRVDARIAEPEKDDRYEERQRRLLLNLDLLTRSEQRSDTLRRQLFEMIQKENEVISKLGQLEYDSRPETIDKGIAFAGSLRPEELRELRVKSLASEKSNLQNLLTEIQKAKASVTLSLDRSDALVEKLRVKLEREIDEAFADDPDQ